MTKKKVVVIGSGFAGMASAALLAKDGYAVTLLEKNDSLGGRARQWQKDGFTFDMGPSWYWMPDVFEHFFNMFGHKVSDFYELKRLDPSYRVFTKSGQAVDLPANTEELYALFEKFETGAADKLRKFLDVAEYKYKVGIYDYAFRPSHSIFEFVDTRILVQMFKMQLISSLSSEVSRLFKHPVLREILEFPVLFLGSTPQRTPALYSLMNYADMAKGTWYPMGGMHQIVLAFTKLLEKYNVSIHTNAAVKEILTLNGKAQGVKTDTQTFPADYVIAAADYAHVEQNLLPKQHRRYDAKYWENRELSPSSLLYYVGVEDSMANMLHHNLFFDEDFNQHAYEIYNKPQWPSKPLFYASCPSLTDASVAPVGTTNLFLLIPLATGIADTEALREPYFHTMLARIKKLTGNDIADKIILKRSYAHTDFIQDYNSLRGNAYGLANTLFQTAFLKPKMRAKGLDNLFFAGQLTVPGPGVPPAIISGIMAAREVVKMDK